jgi:PhzF family phenazine biosynthesis protein
MNVLKIAAFSAGPCGGNPAGVVIEEALPSTEEMQCVAALVGFSETVFAAASGQGWRVRYFSPQAEIPFCGHATIALGAALAAQRGAGVFPLSLNHTAITVEGYLQGEAWAAALQSPPTRSQAATEEMVAEAVGLFGYRPEALDPRLPPALIHAGADHLFIALRETSWHPWPTTLPRARR